MPIPALVPLLAPLIPVAASQDLDFLDSVEAMLTADVLDVAAQVEQWVTDLPPVEAGAKTPTGESAAAFETWDDDWQALMASQDFEADMARVMVEGLALRRRWSAVPWPEFEERSTRLRREGSQVLVMALLRLELLDRSAPEQQGDFAVEWLRSGQSGRSKQLETLFEAERAAVARLGALRPGRGSAEDAIRSHRYGFRRVLDDQVMPAMQRGFDHRLQEALVVRWLVGHASPDRRGLLVEAAAAVKEERWTNTPLYFDACVRMGTLAAIEECVDALGRIEDLRDELERERRRGSKLVEKRAPRDWELSKDDWTVLREAVIADHDRVLDRRVAALEHYSRSAEQRLAAFASTLGSEGPEPGGARAHAAWKRWLKGNRSSLPEALAGKAR